MSSLPQGLDNQKMQNRWADILNPLIRNPMSQGTYLNNVVLASGANVINHTLGHMQQGWLITDINSAATIYRSQPFNNLTLTLTSSAAVTVTLYVY